MSLNRKAESDRPEVTDGIKVRYGQKDMKYAKASNGERVEATKEGPKRATCFSCGENVFAKVGVVIVSHWCHEANSKCVHAGEYHPETDWHQEWKGLVPIENREVSIRRNGKLRRADIRAKTKTVIELQHSAIDAEEVASREEFYGKNMFWIYDGNGNKRTLFRVSSSRSARKDFSGNDIYECRISDRIPGLFETRRPKLVDQNEEVLRVVPHATNSPRNFLVVVKSGEMVRSMVKQTCDADNPSVNGFCLDDVGDWATKEKQKQIRRATSQSSGQYMTDYCPRGYIPDAAKPGRLSWMSWSEINEMDERSF